MAALAAAATFGAPLMHPSGAYLGDPATLDSRPRSPIHEAADFLRRWPQANADAVVIHLRRAGFHDVPDPEPRALAAWKVFAFALACLDDVDKQEADPPQEAAPAPAWPGDRALQPQAGAFDPASGLAPRR